MDWLSFFLGFFTAITMMGFTMMIVGAIWLKSYLSHKDKQSKTPGAINKKRRVPIQIDTELFGG